MWRACLLVVVLIGLFVSLFVWGRGAGGVLWNGFNQPHGIMCLVNQIRHPHINFQ